jgi:hypothetical protein
MNDVATVTRAAAWPRRWHADRASVAAGRNSMSPDRGQLAAVEVTTNGTPRRRATGADYRRRIPIEHAAPQRTVRLDRGRQAAVAGVCAGGRARRPRVRYHAQSRRAADNCRGGDNSAGRRHERRGGAPGAR